MAEHTAGEWVANGLRIQTVEHGTVLAMVCKYDLYDDTAYADAKRMAAAPDMLAALEVLTHNWDTVDEDSRPEGMTQALAAIAKAKGEPYD